MFVFDFGTPQRTTVVKDGAEWTVSTIRDGHETIAFEESGDERQIYVNAVGHDAAVARFTAATITAETESGSSV